MINLGDETRKRPVIFLAMLLMLLPAILVAVVLWQTFSHQIDNSYEKRLIANLSVLELAIGRSVSDFRNALTRLSADNTLQVTVDLDIRPQLKRYLTSQFDISDFSHIQIASNDGKPLVTVGRESDANSGCRYAENSTTEVMHASGNYLFLSRSVPLLNGKRHLGYVCAGYAINSEEATNAVIQRMEGLAQLGWQGIFLPFGGDRLSLGQSMPVGTVFDTLVNKVKYLAMGGDLNLSKSTIRMVVLVDTSHSNELFNRALWVTGFVVLAILIFAVFALKMLGMRQQAEGELQLEREKAVVTLASIADGVVTVNPNGDITYTNSAACKLIGGGESNLLGKPWQEIFDLQSEKTGKRVLDLINLAHGRQDIDTNDSILIGNDGTRKAVHFSVAPIYRDRTYSGAVITFRDVRQERELRRRLAWKASRDDLTGLLNRSEFRRTLTSTLDSIQNNTIHHCLLYIDLDEFKVVNDTCGHKAGDDLLRQVCSGILIQLRESDIVARLGGDEFGVLLQNCQRSRGIELANNLIESINDIRFTFQEKTFHVGASIGLVSVTQETKNLEDLLATVDAACYAAKEEGRNRVFVGQVDPTKISHRMEELRQASHIRHALKDDRFTLYKQPIVLTANPSEAVHSEVLVRMIDKNGQLTVPGAFIPIAERHGLMQDVDRWIINHLFELEGEVLRYWKPGNTAMGTKNFVYSINLSAASLTDPTFFQFVKECFRKYQIPAGAIAFEVTETQVITHLEKAVGLIVAIKELGCSFLLDDFGSGMSSFGYLKTLPLDYLKIDGSFVKDILADPIDRSMVNMMNEIGHVMGLTTIAEYVENEEILRAIQDIGVDMAQGFGISMPHPMEENLLINQSNIA
ncbi:MAG: EAL domain-containing protein [Candidatus Thiodiazotropha sp. DIVDIV]